MSKDMNDKTLVMSKNQQTFKVMEATEEEFLEQINGNSMVGGIPTIEDAISSWYDNNQEDVTKVLDVIVDEMKNDQSVIVAVELSEGLFDIDENEGEYAENQVNVTFRTLDVDDDKQVCVAFTNIEEMKKGPKTSTTVISLVDFMKYVYEDDGLLGLVFNPWGKSFTLPKEIIGDMLEIIRPLTEDEIALNKGSEAYQKGDFETAFKYYQEAADAGNVTALSNLGYCYYYGRNVKVDKEKARTCWEMAAIFGDICATYKLGDMYRNGDLPKNENYARALYRKALEMTGENPDLYSYPDVYLRILKYCKDLCDDEIYKTIAKEAVEGFKARIEEGDKYSDKLLREAVDIYNSLGIED